jgi:hypothetical protein
MTRRFWTTAEDEFVAANYERSSATEIGKRINRSTRAVYNRAILLGLTGERRAWTDADDAELKRLNAEGWSDTQVGVRMRRERHIVSAYRKRLGLPSHAYGEKAIESVRAGVRKQLDRLGVRDMARLRLASWAERARQRGWPDRINGRPINLRFVEILDLLYEHGPQTRRGIAERLDMKTQNQRKLLNSRGKGGSYLAELMRAGLVANLGKIVKGQGKGRSVNLYCLSLDVERGRCSG